MSGCEAVPEVKKIIRAMAKNRVEAGITDAASLVDSIHEEIHGHTPLWKSEIADIIAGIGEARKQTKSEMQTRLDAIKKELKTKQVSAEKPTAEQAKIEARQKELTQEIADLQAKIAAQDTSKPVRAEIDSPAITELKRQRDALKQRLDNLKPAPPATRPVDPNVAKNKAAQTAMKKQIDALTQRLEARDTSKPVKPEPKWTEETQAIRTQRDKLAQRFADMGASERDESQAQTRLKGQIDAINRQIAEGGATTKGPKATVDSAEVTALKQRVAAAKDALEALSPKPAKPSADETMNATRRAALTREMGELQRKLDTGDFSKPVKNKPVYDEETRELQAQRDALTKKVDKAVQKIEWANQSTPAKIRDRALGTRRAIILSSLTTGAKLMSAAVQRMVTTPLEESVGSVLRQIPGLRGIADQAPREGAGFNPRAEAQAAMKTFSKKTGKEMIRMIREGAGTNDALYGKDKDSHFPWLDMVGRIHGALKKPAEINEFNRALTQRTESFQKGLVAKGMQPAEVMKTMSSPQTQSMLEALSYADSKRAIFMNDNPLVNSYRMAVGNLHRSGGGHSALATALEYMLPIVKIPTNFVGEATSYAAGGAKAMGSIIKNGVKNLTPEQADYIMRNLKKQTVGAALLAVGYMSPQAIGGYYQAGDKPDKSKPDAGGIRVFGHEIPKYLVHNPALEMLQMGATLRHVMDSKKKGEGTVGAGAFAAGKGVLGEIPFFDAPVRLATGLKDYTSAGKFAGEQVRDAVVPPDLQRYAKASDPEKVFKRQPEGFVDAIKTGVPGLREQVPLGSYKKLSLDQRMDAVDEIRDPSQRATMMEHVMASSRRDEKKLTTAQHDRLNSLIQQGEQ